MKLLMKAGVIFDRTIDILALLAAILLILIMLAVNGQVVSRYFLGRMSGEVFEITTYSLLFITFLASAWLLREEGHIKMDLILNQLNPNHQALLNVITSILGVIICLAFTWYGVQVAWDQFQGGYYIVSELEPPRWPIVAIIPVGSFLLLVQFLRRMHGFLRGLRLLRSHEQKS